LDHGDAMLRALEMIQMNNLGERGSSAPSRDRQLTSMELRKPDGAIHWFAVHLPDYRIPRQLSSPGESAQLRGTQRIGLVGQDFHRFRQRHY
jgi:hypothetical protein